MKPEFKILPVRNDVPWDNFDGILLPFDAKAGLDKGLKLLPRPLSQEILVFSKRFEFKGEASQVLSFDSGTTRRIVVGALPKHREMFSLLGWARESLKSLKEAKAKTLLVDLRSLKDKEALADAFTSALIATQYELPKYGKKEEKKKGPSIQVSFACLPADHERLEIIVKSAEVIGEENNLVRKLATMAGNDLTTTRYVRMATELAREQGLTTEFYSLRKLEQLKAGAFLAVAQGSEDKGGGILKISYAPRKGHDGKTFALVGKGITYDTGGNNLKTGNYMYGMHEDMTGSAVALAVIRAAARLNWKQKIVAYLAITDNVLSPTAFRPNDVLVSLKGKTIEVVDTDAEGRLILSDTLFLASRDNPDLILDFATLTGTCIRAVGTVYSGAYTNRRRLMKKIIESGRVSGERVWPFPNDADYGEALKSEVADLKNCRLTGGPDHIEAGYFLSQFVPKSIPWVHVDLAAAHHEGGLAHVPTKTTGFGVRFAKAFLQDFAGPQTA